MKGIITKVRLQQSIGDPGCFYKNGPIISTHVDDMMAIAPTEKQLKDIEIAIAQHVELDKLGIPKKLPRMELSWDKKSVKLIQKTLIGNLAKEQDLPMTNIPTKSLP